MAFSYKFAVVRGVQAQREYFIAMIPLGLLSKLFQNEDEYVQYIPYIWLYRFSERVRNVHIVNFS